MRFTTLLFLFLVGAVVAQESAVVEDETTEALLVSEEVEEVDDLDALLAEELPNDATTETVPNDVPADDSVVEETSEDAATEEEATTTEEQQQAEAEATPDQLPEQSGPFIDLLGAQLYSLEMIDETQAQLTPQLTNEALKGKKVVGLYFSADWWCVAPFSPFVANPFSYWNHDAY